MSQSRNVLGRIAAAASAAGVRIRPKPTQEPPKVSFTDTSEGGTEDMTPRNDDLEPTGHEYPVGEAAQRVGRLRMNKLVLQPPLSKPRMGPLLVVCITACNESYEELQYCLSTFHGRCPPDLNLGMVYVFLDSCPDETMQETNETFKALAELMDLQMPPSGRNIVEGGCRVYRGTLGYIQARLYVKGRGDFQRSKRRSITAFYTILRDRIASGVSEEPLAILHMDGDTGSATRSRDNDVSSYGLETVGKMLRIMDDSPKLGAIASQVRVLCRTRNILTLMQSFDCSTTYVGVFGGSSLIGRSIACFGMAVMYRYRVSGQVILCEPLVSSGVLPWACMHPWRADIRALLQSKVKDVPSPMEAFSRTPGKNLVDLVNLDMNEDQGMTTFIMRAGYDTKVSVVTRFYTFAPETLAELMGQRRRWQAGYFVGMPSQVFGFPSPHLQIKKYRWLMAFVVMTMWANAFLLPGTVGVGLALIFGQAYEGYLLKGQEYETGTGVPVECRLQEGLFAVGVWTFWLLFIAATIDRAPEHIRNRCRVFFGTACVVSVGLCLSAAVVSEGVQTFVILVIALNLTVGLALTYDIREWPHRLQEIILYVIFLYAIQPMITMYSVANIDSALWGTRSVGNVNATAKALDATPSPPFSEPPASQGLSQRRRRRRGRPVIAPVALVPDGGNYSGESCPSQQGSDEDDIEVASPPRPYAESSCHSRSGRRRLTAFSGAVGEPGEDTASDVLRDVELEVEELNEEPRTQVSQSQRWQRYRLAVTPLSRTGFHHSRDAGCGSEHEPGVRSPHYAPPSLPPLSSTPEFPTRYRWNRYKLAVAPAAGHGEEDDLQDPYAASGLGKSARGLPGKSGEGDASPRPSRRRARPRYINHLEPQTAAPVATTSAADEEQGVPWSGGASRRETRLRTRASIVKRRRRCCGMSLRKRKLIVLAVWLLVNMGVTVIFLLWRLYLVVVLNFFSNFAGLVTIVVAARVEAFLQRRSSHPPSANHGRRSSNNSSISGPTRQRPKKHRVGSVNVSDSSSLSTLVSKWASSTEMV